MLKTLPLPCVPAAAGGGNGTAVALRFDCRRGSKTLPLPCVPIALVAKTVSSPCGHQVDPEQVKAKFDKATSRLNVTLKVSRRRDSRCAAPPSAFSRRFDRDGEGIQQMTVSPMATEGGQGARGAAAAGGAAGEDSGQESPGGETVHGRGPAARHYRLSGAVPVNVVVNHPCLLCVCSSFAVPSSCEL